MKFVTPTSPTIETILVTPKPSLPDPMGQRGYVGLKFGLIVEYFDGEDRDEAIRKALAGIEATLVDAMIAAKEPV